MNQTIPRINLLVFMLVQLTFFSKGQSLDHSQKDIFDYGFPSIQNFGPKEYEGHAQTWGITQSPNGLMYIGTSEGLLEFDGNNWTSIKLPNRTRVRALATCPEGLIYCGGANDLGFLETSSENPTSFVSLRNKLPPEIGDFDQVMNVIYWKGEVFFRTLDHLFVWNIDQKEFTVHEATIRFSSLRLIQNHIWIKSVGEGYLTYSDGQLNRFAGNHEALNSEYNIAMEWNPDSVLFAFKDKFMFYSRGQFSTFNTEIDSKLKNIYLSDAMKLSKNRLAISTKDGLYFLNQNGQLLLHLNEESGLADDNIKSVFVDREGALWSSSNFGLSRIAIHIPIKKYDEKNGIFDTVNDILKDENTLYVSTHTGLFKFDPQSDNRFNQVGNPIDESFALEFVDDQLWVSTVNGIYRKESNDIFGQVCRDFAYKFQQSVFDPRYVFVGAIDGLVLLKKEQNGMYSSISLRHLIKNDVRYMNQDTSGILWVGTNNNKLLKLDFFEEGSITAPKIIKYDHNDGLPVSHIQVNSINNEIFFSSEFGVFEKKGESFHESTRFPPLRSIVYYMYEASDNAVYTLFGEPPFMKILPFERDGNKFKPKSLPELSGIESPGLWVAYEDPIDESIWFGMTNGVLNFQPDKFQKSKNDISTNLRRIWVNSDSIIASNINQMNFQNNSSKTQKRLLDYELNSLKFNFGLPSFDNNESNRFQHRLLGLDDQWASWTKDKTKEYIDLFEGDYTFQVKGKNVYGSEAQIASFQFKILPPWYRAWWFLFVVFALFVTIIFFIVRYISQRRLILRVEELEFQQKIQKERERISNDLHDHVGAQLTSIISGLQVTEEIKELKSNAQAKSLIDSLQEDAKTTMASLRDSIWTLKNETITVEKFVEHIESHLESQLKYNDHIKPKFVFQGNKELEIGPKRVLHLTRTIQEAIQNVLKHAQADLITISITSGKGNISLKVTDNGVGFDLSKVEGEHFGIENMKNRIENIGGAFTINSSTSKGTEIDISI